MHDLFFVIKTKSMDVILSDPPCGIPDSQQYPWKVCPIKYELDILDFNLKNWLFLTMGSLQKWFAHLLQEYNVGTIRIKNFSSI